MTNPSGQYCSKCCGYYYTSFHDHQRSCPWEHGCPYCKQRYVGYQHTLNCPSKLASSPYPFGSAQHRSSSDNQVASPVIPSTEWFHCKRCNVHVMKDRLEEHLKSHPSQGLPDENQEIKIIDRRDEQPSEVDLPGI